MLLLLLLAVAYFYAFLAGDAYDWDFRIYYVASTATHAHLDPYLGHGDVSAAFATPFWEYRDSAFIYPPTSLFFFSQLWRLSYQLGKTLFSDLTTGAVILALVQLFRRQPRLALLPVLLFVSMPMLVLHETGNVEGLVFALSLAAFLLGDSVLSGLSLAGAIALKLHPVLFLPWFVARRKWRSALTASLALGALGTLSVAKWGWIYWKEFVFNLTHHFGPHKGLLVQQQQLREWAGPRGSLGFLVTPDGVFSEGHDLFGVFQNPFHLFDQAAWPLALAVTAVLMVTLLFSRLGTRLPAERSYFLLMVITLFANPLLWPTCLVGCFPLTMLLVYDSSVPYLSTVLLAIPLMLPVRLVGSRNFALWLLSAAWVAWQNGWLH